MKSYFFPEHDPRGQYLMLMSDLLETPVIYTGEWQAMDVSGSKMHGTHELEDVTLVWDQMPAQPADIFPAIDLDWAWEHHKERVSGQPLNPAPSHVRWPYAVGGNARHIDTTDKFDHTYPERFWPRYAGTGNQPVPPVFEGNHLTGVRFPYGDLDSLVDLLASRPLTRQAFLPVWFPEDTGATENQRVPCTLGYHFMQRGGKLSCRYYMRSCEAYRHLSNDVFFAAALTDWICTQIRIKSNRELYFRPGSLHMHISSLHAFVGDERKIKQRLTKVSNEAIN